MNLQVGPSTFIYAASLFLLLLLCQVIVWRVQIQRHGKVRKQILALFLIYLGGPLLALAASQDLAGTMLVLSHSVPYILIFPAAAARSPSFEILLLVEREPGLTVDQVRSRLGKGRLLEDRLKDLSDDGLMKADRSLSFAGRCVASFFALYRHCLGLKRGSG